MAGNLWSKAAVWAAMIKIEHSVFALPFAYMGAFWAARGWPGWDTFLLLTLAMVAVRSFAMTVNRVADLKYDRENPRTSTRALVTGEISVKEACLFILICALIFVAACAFLNSLCFYLSFAALFWSAVYSFSKRFTSFCHFHLGSVLGLAPIAGWIAYEPAFAPAPFFLFLGVSFWAAGFDILYSGQDISFDQEHSLHSIPSRYGLDTAFALAGFSHVNASLFFFISGLAAGAGAGYFLFWAMVSVLLAAEHKIISPGNMQKINVSFFVLNGAAAILLFAGVLWDTLAG
ncbi:MAG: UbiA-like polyprenyltransferase [Desulfonatronovibrionaceae bacterium]